MAVETQQQSTQAIQSIAALTTDAQPSTRRDARNYARTRLRRLYVSSPSPGVLLQRCAVSLPRRRVRAKKSKKAEKSENAMHRVVCVVPPPPSSLLHSRGFKTSTRRLLTIRQQKFYCCQHLESSRHCQRFNNVNATGPPSSPCLEA